MRKKPADELGIETVEYDDPTKPVEQQVEMVEYDTQASPFTARAAVSARDFGQSLATTTKSVAGQVQSSLQKYREEKAAKRMGRREDLRRQIEETGEEVELTNLENEREMARREKGEMRTEKIRGAFEGIVAPARSMFGGENRIMNPPEEGAGGLRAMLFSTAPSRNIFMEGQSTSENLHSLVFSTPTGGNAFTNGQGSTVSPNLRALITPTPSRNIFADTGSSPNLRALVYSTQPTAQPTRVRARGRQQPAQPAFGSGLKAMMMAPMGTGLKGLFAPQGSLTGGFRTFGLRSKVPPKRRRR